MGYHLKVIVVIVFSTTTPLLTELPLFTGLRPGSHVWRTRIVSHSCHCVDQERTWPSLYFSDCISQNSRRMLIRGHPCGCNQGLTKQGCRRDTWREKKQGALSLCKRVRGLQRESQRRMRDHMTLEGNQNSQPWFWMVFSTLILALYSVPYHSVLLANSFSGLSQLGVGFFSLQLQKASLGQRHKTSLRPDANKCVCIHQSDISVGPWSDKCSHPFCTLSVHLESLGLGFTLQYEFRAFYVAFSYDNVEYIFSPAFNQMGIILRRYNYSSDFAGS